MLAWEDPRSPEPLAPFWVSAGVIDGAPVPRSGASTGDDGDRQLLLALDARRRTSPSAGSRCGSGAPRNSSASSVPRGAEAAAKLAWIVKEIGDCLLSADLGVDLEEVARLNLRKLGASLRPRRSQDRPLPPREAVAVPMAVDGALLVRVLRGFWTGEGTRTSWRPWRAREFRPHGEGKERILLSVAEIPPLFPNPTNPTPAGARARGTWPGRYAKSWPSGRPRGGF